MGLLKKAMAAFLLLVLFTAIFAFFSSIGIMQAKIGSNLYFLIFFTWIFFEVIFSTM